MVLSPTKCSSYQQNQKSSLQSPSPNKIFEQDSNNTLQQPEEDYSSPPKKKSNACRRPSRSKEAILAREREKAIQKVRDEQMAREIFGKPLTARNKELIQRAFILGVTKTYNRSRRSSTKSEKKRENESDQSVVAEFIVQTPSNVKRNGYPNLVWEFSDPNDMIEPNVLASALGMHKTENEFACYDIEQSDQNILQKDEGYQFRDEESVSSELTYCN